ncbi:MAG: peptidase MA family metallohydrolase [Sporomusaceae bacterium]|nr:peptidase MA family metallohydrolase [Sporomusaceae bacterium]
MQKLVPATLVPVAVLLMAAIFFLTPLRLSMLFYPLARQAAQSKLDYETRDYSVVATEHFTVRYRDGDHTMAQLVADAAEQAYEPVTAMLGQELNRKTLIVMYPDRGELRKAFGWSGDESAMGVYWGGVIQVLSPRDWMRSGVTAAEFIQSGPMVHEFTHLIFDHQTNGNYPRWFTEGLAQYAEYRINGYEWLTRTNSLSGQLYSIDDLDRRFDELPNQSLAYRQSFAAVRYIAEVHGEDALRSITGQLRDGRSFKQAITVVLAMSYADYDQSWRQWAADTIGD